MKIGFDGKRAFQNQTGLGNYNRSLVTILSQYYPANQYILFAPKRTGLFDMSLLPNISGIYPQSLFYKTFPVLWRRTGISKQIAEAGLDIFHGVSNELPMSIEKIKVKKIVTVHDLIFERFPGTYHFDERYMHRWKIKRSCKTADTIIAISQQTKDDLVDIYHIPVDKISVCYQSCNPHFEQTMSEEQKALVKKRYQLPENYFLFVSSITARKNLIAVCKAIILLKDKLNIPLVVIGNGKKEKSEVKKLMQANGIAERLILLNDQPASKQQPFISGADFPAIYQQALAMIYPSFFEGFGLPILEAMWSGLPVICSNSSSMPEVAGTAALYFPPHNHELLSEYMLEIATNETLADILRAKGLQRAQNFSSKKYAKNIMEIYYKPVQ